MATAWAILVNFLLPPPMILVALLLVPLPRAMRKGLLLFTHRFLSLIVFGSIQLVHLVMAISGLCLLATSNATYKLAHAASDVALTPNQRIAVLAKKWREERNFWIAGVCFVMWMILPQLYKLGHRVVQLEEQLKELQAALQLEHSTGRAPGAPLEAEEQEELALRKRK